MLNLLRYRAKADYGGQTQLPPCSGREAYVQRYVPAFARVAQGEAYSVLWGGKVCGLLAGAPGEQWDDAVIVQYSSFAVLRRVLTSAGYEAEAAPHRRAALADWRLIATTPLNLAR